MPVESLLRIDVQQQPLVRNALIFSAKIAEDVAMSYLPLLNMR